MNSQWKEACPTDDAQDAVVAHGRAPSGWRLARTPLAPEDSQDGGLTLVELTPSSNADAPGGGHEIDDVTGVLTRGALMRALKTRFADRKRRPFALVFVDLEDFKDVNDRNGHLVGDKCLQAFGLNLQQQVRTDDLVGRYGGDEFLILLDGVSDEATYAPVGRRLREGSRVSVPIGTDNIRVGANLGAAYSADGHADIEAMIHAADAAMYAEKRARNGAGHGLGPGPGVSAGVADRALLG